METERDSHCISHDEKMSLIIIARAMLCHLRDLDDGERQTAKHKCAERLATTVVKLFQRPAVVGDVIETSVENPVPGKLRASLDTAEACAFGNELVASGRWTIHEWCADRNCRICNERHKQEQSA